MAIANEQLKLIFADLQNSFENNHNITIKPLDGEFSEKYEVQYSIRGVAQDNNGSVVGSKDHSMLVSIPFGFPHFPPSCKPLSTTFHPDFDKEAICIGDFWNKDRSLVELIIHIAQMISGEKYSTENAFNEAAVAWYRTNSKKLPFEKLGYSEEPEEVISPPEIVEDFEVARSVDTLDDSDFIDSPDYLGLELKQDEEEDEEISFPPSAQSSKQGPQEKIHLLIRQKKYFQLSTVLAKLSNEEYFEDSEEIEKNVEDVLNNARKLQKEADELEHQGNAAEALRFLEQVAELVPDFPNIKENISRTRKTTELTWSPDSEPQKDVGQKKDDDISDSNKSDHDSRVAFFDKKRKSTLKIVPIIAVGIVAALIVAFIVPMFTVNSRIVKVEQTFAQCTAFLAQDNFPQAQQSCDTALALLEGVYFFKKKERDALAAKIKQTLLSKKMLQGLAGKIFFHGQYVQKRDMEIVLAFEKTMHEGDTFLKDKSWENANEKYLAALNLIKPIQDSIDEQILKTVSDNHTIAQINVLLNKGLWFLSAGEIDKSSEAFNQARSLAKQLPAELQGTYISEIDSKMSEIEYLQLLDLGESFFASNDWEGAIKQYEKALKLHNESSLTEKRDDVKTLYANMAEAELYSLISHGKEAFARSRWNEAISQYQKAIELLNKKQKMLERINPAEIQQQLQRIILRVRIVQNKQVADQKLEKLLYSEAIEAFKTVLKVISERNMENDEEFRAIYAGTKKSIGETRAKVEIANKIEYLVKNYKQIFQDNYAAAIPQYLRDPKAAFMKNIGNKQVFELQCVEDGPGRTLRLVILYMYDPDTKKWQFYSETSASYTGNKKSIAKAKPRTKPPIADKITYLTKNYKQIFQDNYAEAIPQYMKDPKAAFIKKIGEKQLFELQCLESTQNQTVRLVMLYIYDPDTKLWQLYDKTT
jgi:ubiquitin-protein ligase